MLANEKGMCFLNSEYEREDTRIKVNKTGFLANFDYDKETISKFKKQGKKIVFIIGDSFVEGVSDGGYETMFVEILRKELEEYVFLNFGVSGAAPLNYQLIVEKYAPELEPDLIIVCLFSNDFLAYERIAKPYIPIYYEILYKGGLSGLASEKPYELNNGRVNDFLISKEEAFYYYKNCAKISTHFSPHFSKIISLSSLFSELSSVFIESKISPLYYKNDAIATNLHQILKVSKKAKSNLRFVFIPDKNNLINSKNELYSEFDFLETFDSFIIEPKGMKINKKDYIYNNAHFNVYGNKKFAEFLMKEIKSINF